MGTCEEFKTGEASFAVAWPLQGYPDAVVISKISMGPGVYQRDPDKI